jgi:WD40 repeat protein
MWKKQFSHLPTFERTGGEGSLSLLSIWGEEPVTSVAFSSDGTRIVSGSQDKSVRVWDASTGAELKKRDGIYDWIHYTRIVSGSDDDSVPVRLAHTDPWHLSSNGCIMSVPHHQRLMWVPREIMKILNPPSNLLNITLEPSAKVDFTDCRIGPAWVACYTPQNF